MSTRHLSIRVPWHDSGWNGTVCTDPAGNSACLALTLIAERRNDAVEAQNAGKCISDLSTADRPPCVRERGAFLSERSHALDVVMPYSAYSPAHKHIMPAAVQLPGWGALMVPYRWMLKEPATELASSWGVALDMDREPKAADGVPDFVVNTPWIQEVENQRLMLEKFAEPVMAGHSLVFFYAKQTPLSDSGGRAIVAVALVENVGKVDEYPYAPGTPSGAIRSMIWERSFQHSLRRNKDGSFSGGVVLPYQAILARAQEDPSVTPADYLAYPPEESVDQFLYGSEHVTHGAAIGALQSVRNAIERIEAIIDGPWAESKAWIDTQLNAIWAMRGVAPGLGSALTCLEPQAFNGTLFAHALSDQLEPDADPWPRICEIFDNKRPAPFNGPKLTQMLRKRWAKLVAEQPAKFALMKMLSRFELTKTQAVAAFEQLDPMRIVRNPYVLFEESRGWKEPVAFGTVDQGLYGKTAAKAAWPFPDETEVNTEEPDDAYRLRAITVDILERRAATGDTLLTADQLRDSAKELPLTVPAPIDETVLELCQDEFAPEVAITEVDGKFYAQLERYCLAGDIIRAHVETRLATPPAVDNTDWRASIDKHFKAFDAEDRDEEAARTEKADALGRLATSRLAVLTGPAGSGKTSLLQLLLDRADIVGPHVLLLAPTGKARVRLGKQTNRPNQAKTLAQFLLQQERWDPETGVYKFDQTGQTAQVTTCVVDESSMLTEDQMAALMSAIPKSARLIFVGDPDQLPPIGAGRPFVDLITHLKEERGGAGLARLEISRRQVGGKPVPSLELSDVQLAELFSNRQMGPAEDEIASRIGADFADDRLRLVQWDTAAHLRERIVEVIQQEFGHRDADLERAVELSLGGTLDTYVYFNMGAGEKAEEWQILSVHKDLPGGSAEMNRHLKRTVRSQRLAMARRQGYGWGVIEPRGPDQITYGDKVICLRNHKRRRWNPKEQAQDGYLANGEVGIVVGDTSTPKPRRWTKIEFATQPGEQFSFESKDFSDHASPTLELGYAVTVHKAQGSEFGAVFLVLPANSRLLSRELIYTALTRQKSRVWILHQGPFAPFLRMRSDYYSESAKRTTNLFRDPKPRLAAAPAGGTFTEAPRFLEEYLIHATRRGDLVRSKSEIVIADILFEFEQKGGLRYSYEKALTLPGPTDRWPDFTIEAGADTWFWEHCGMLDNASYRKRWEAKLDAYAAAGISIWSDANPDGRLIVTEDGPSKGLDSSALHDMAKQLWG